MVKSVLSRERVVIGADFNGHVGDEVLGRYALMERNTERQICKKGENGCGEHFPDGRRVGNQEVQRIANLDDTPGRAVGFLTKLINTVW